MIEIPADRLGAEVLTALIEEFVLQEGTDYGRQETDLASKVKQVRGQIEKGDVMITYEEETESCNLMTKHAYKRFIEAV